MRQSDWIWTQTDVVTPYGNVASIPHSHTHEWCGGPTLARLLPFFTSLKPFVFRHILVVDGFLRRPYACLGVSKPPHCPTCPTILSDSGLRKGQKSSLEGGVQAENGRPL